MIIEKMTARFGKLQNDSLTLQPGLNIVELPNEAGKSTWTEFLLSMLYGVDTGERKKAGVVPVKEKYRPWEGGEMSGSVALEADGKRITIERSSTAKAPLSKFRAYETESGLPVALSAADCGRTLVHAERSVYERSGFIRQQQLTVTQDAALEQKLASLVTTGDENMAYSNVEKQLRGLKNSCRHNRTGLIPETEQQLSEAEGQLRQVYAVQESMAEAEARRQSLREQRAVLQHGKAVCEALEAERRHARVTETEAELQLAEDQYQHLLAQCELLPPQAELESLLADVDRAAQDGRELEIRRSYAPAPPQMAALPQALRTTERENLAFKAKADSTKARQLQETPTGATRAPLLIGLVLLLAAILLAVFGKGALWIAAGALLAVGIGLVVLYILLQRKAKAAYAEAQAQLGRLLRSYNAEGPEDFAPAAEAAEQAYRDFEAATAQRQSEQSALDAQGQALQTRIDALLQRVDAFGARTEDLNVARKSVETALKTRSSLDAARFRVNQLKTTLADRRALAGPLPQIDPGDRVRYGSADPMQLAAALGRCEAELSALQTRLDTAAGRLSAMGDSLALEAGIARSRERLDELNQKNAALSLALDALGEANRELQARFSPLVCQRAAELFSRLTGGRYEKVLLSSDMSVSVQEPGVPVTRLLQLLSGGTIDQLYLALRLAISELLLPEAPIVLDDALVAFDDERARVALQVLAEEAQSRQILLFTCQSRERRLAAAK